MSYTEPSPSTEPETDRLSKLWDIFIPILIAAIPAGSFTLLRQVTAGLDKPDAEAPTWVIVTMATLILFGVISMAVVVLKRAETRIQQLTIDTAGKPPLWRRLALTVSIVSVLLFDIFSNLASAFSGAEFLLVASVPCFILYIACIRVAFAGL